LGWPIAAKNAAQDSLVYYTHLPKTGRLPEEM
jgi:hypothetical protein